MVECNFIQSHFNEGVKEGEETFWEVNNFKYQLGRGRGQLLVSKLKNEERNTLDGPIFKYDNDEMEEIKKYAEEVKAQKNIHLNLGEFGVFLSLNKWRNGICVHFNQSVVDSFRLDFEY